MNKRPTPANAQKLTLAVILCACESATTKNSWRTNDSGTRHYLRYRESHGHPLSAVERCVCGESAEESEQETTTLTPKPDPNPLPVQDTTQVELSEPDTEADAA